MSMLNKANEIIQNKDIDSNLTELYSEIVQKIISKYKLNDVAIKQNQISLKDELQWITLCKVYLIFIKKVARKPRSI